MAISTQLLSLLPKLKDIRPSILQKVSSPDNGILKSEMFYYYDKDYGALNDLEQVIIKYIYYYNNKCIKEKIEGLSPMEYRIQSFGLIIIR